MTEVDLSEPLVFNASNQEQLLFFLHWNADCVTLKICLLKVTSMQILDIIL